MQVKQYPKCFSKQENPFSRPFLRPFFRSNDIFRLILRGILYGRTLTTEIKKIRRKISPFDRKIPPSGKPTLCSRVVNKLLGSRAENLTFFKKITTFGPHIS